MKILKDIVCSSTPFGEMYTDNELTGKVLIDNEKLEGIVLDDNNSYLVFGTVTDYDIKVIVCTNHDKKLPRMYEGSFDNKKYYGEKSVANRFESIPYEECQIGLYDPQYYRDVDLDEIEKLEKVIKLRKKTLGREAEAIYENLYQDEEVFSKAF